MTQPDDKGRGIIGFAEKLLALLDEGRFTATYKYAVLIGLMDLCMENSLESGLAPESVTTRQLAEKVIEIYWPQTSFFNPDSSPSILLQNTNGQAEIVSSIATFRTKHAPDLSTPLAQARAAARPAFERLVNRIEWKLIQMPLPRVQRFETTEDRFVYEIGWTEDVQREEVLKYQRGERGHFDNQIRFKPGVGEYLLQLNGLLRPLIHRKWAAMVSRLNKLHDAQLEDFLFGVDRTSTTRIRGGIWELQQERCFYCSTRIREPHSAELDHFIPWSRYPDNGIENLVVADKTCNGYKRDFLAAGEHVLRWSTRFSPSSREAISLKTIAEPIGWERHPDRTWSAARVIYLRLQTDYKLWHFQREFVSADLERIRTAFHFAE
ncbi:MAG: hypothetical protein LAO31_19695 [Acidobacteriia bacterium]|nr:hypothetical protein [Terriglobia bacterium]